MNSNDEAVISKLQQRLYELSWKGEYGGRDGAIAVSKELFRLGSALSDQKPLSGLSSTYYSAAGNAWATAKSSGFPVKIFWMIRAFIYMKKAVHLSDTLAKEVGLSGMTPDELDVRSAILRKARRFNDALACGLNALCRIGIPWDTRVLLLIGVGETHDALKDQTMARRAYRLALELLGNVKPTTRVRYYRSHASHLCRSSEIERARQCWEEAIKIAIEYDLYDQIAKIRAESAD
jgi:tetratricopeptide (TPR) repeat protein